MQPCIASWITQIWLRAAKLACPCNTPLTSNSFASFDWQRATPESHVQNKPLVCSKKKLFCGFPGYKPVPPGWFKIVCWFYVGNTERLTESGFMEKPGIEPATPGLHGEAGNRTCDPWFTRHSAYPLHHGGSFPLVCSIGCPCWHWLFRFSVLHSNQTFIRLNIEYKIVLSP